MNSNYKGDTVTLWQASKSLYGQLSGCRDHHGNGKWHVPEPVEDRSHMNEPTIRDNEVPRNWATHRKGGILAHENIIEQGNTNEATISDDRDPAFNKFPDIPQIECDQEDD